MSFVIGAVTLPLIPQVIRYKLSADVKSYMQPSTGPLLILFGAKADVLVIEGWFRVVGQTKANLVTNYVSPLEALAHTDVTIQYVGRAYHNTDFLFVKFDHDERGGIVRGIPYRMEFWKGSAHTVI